MFKLTWFEISIIIMTIITIGLLFYGLFIMFQHGKLIIKAESYRIFAIILALLLLLSIQNLYDNLKTYIQFKECGISIKSVYTSIMLIDINIVYLYHNLIGSQIRENGIYNYGYFYKWSRVKSFTWTSPTTIQFKVKSLLIFNGKFEMQIKEELKLKAEETLQKYIKEGEQN